MQKGGSGGQEFARNDRSVDVDILTNSSQQFIFCLLLVKNLFSGETDSVL